MTINAFYLNTLHFYFTATDNKTQIIVAYNPELLTRVNKQDGALGFGWLWKLSELSNSS